MTGAFPLPPCGVFIQGVWHTEGLSGFEVISPLDGQVLASVSRADAALTAQAIGAADLAFTGWAATPAKDRAKILKDWHRLILDHQDYLAHWLHLESGKPKAEAQGEVAYAAAFVEWYAAEALRAYGQTIPSFRADAEITVIWEPVGVVAAITPWNFPAAMVTRKLAPALAAGCSVVLKPAEATPLTALALIDLAHKAGVPAGVVNVLCTNTPAVVGDVLCADPRIKKLSFTGSTAVGRALMAACAPTLKRLSLELGGNAPFIVCEDADIDAAVAGAMAAKFRNAGQTCICANRFLVHHNIHNVFADKLRHAMAGLAVGPLINGRALEKVNHLLADAQAQGARCEEVPLSAPALASASYSPPVLVRGATLAMNIAREEIFGPVAALYPFKDDTEALAMANDTPYGLAAYVYTPSLRRAGFYKKGLKAGMVGVNTGLISSETVPFGGVDQSGFGREGGRQGLEAFMHEKYIITAGL